MTRRGLLLAVAPLASALLAACDDPAAPERHPCDTQFACQVEGVDIALLGIVPLWEPDQAYDEEVGAHVLEPGDTFVVDVLIVNRGTAVPTDSILVYGYFRDFEYFVSAGRVVRPLEVGENAIVPLAFLVPSGERWVLEPGSETHAEGYFALGGDFLAEDVDPSNHRGPPLAYHPRVPILDIAPIDVPDTMRSHRAFETVLAIVNRSPFVDYAGGGELEFCMTHFAHGYCEQGLVATHSPVTIGAIDADESVVVPVTIEFTGESLWYFDSESIVFLNPCLAGSQPLCLHRREDANDYRVAIPDLLYECPTPALAPPDTLHATSSYCLGDGADEGIAHTFGIFSGSAGDCFRVTSLGDGWSPSVMDMNLALVPLEAAGDCHRLPRDGDYFLSGRTAAPADPAGGILVIEQI